MSTIDPPETRSLLRGWHLLLCVLLSGCAGLLACDKDKSRKPAAEPSKSEIPTLRVYAVSGAAGAIEPCGCVKDMLGGIDHAAAYVDSQKELAPHSIVVGAGPMFFEDPETPAPKAAQSSFKAETMAESLGALGMVAWAPGANDWASGVDTFGELVGRAGVEAIAANLKEGAGPVHKTRLIERGGIQVGIVGVSLPERLAKGVTISVADAGAALVQGATDVVAQGAQIVIALIAAQRGEALRLIELAQAQAVIQVAVIGKAFDQGEGNDQPYSPELIGSTLVVQSPNHLQGVGVVDLFVRDGNYQFADGSGLAREADKQRIAGQIEELEARIKTWQRRGGLRPEDLAQQRSRLTELRARRAALERPVAPPQGSYFSYQLVPVRESFGQDQKVSGKMDEYYRRVNEHNKQAFADRLPPPAQEGESSYVGTEACSECHRDERQFYETTGHARAYATLAVQSKEYNLDCVACHVTGYEKPGGSTVTHVEKLKNVGCEVCHGPGSRHAELPTNPAFIQRAPPRELCADACHHPPHVGDKWDVTAAWPKILGPGHGQPKPD